MLKSYRTEIKPTQRQITKINQSIGTCRFLYNSYIAKNKELYELYKEGKSDKAFMSANDFDKYMNHEVKTQDEWKWIGNCGAKARKKSICNAEAAFKRFFHGKSGFPKFKKKNKQKVKLYFPKNNKTDWKIERHRINIPTFKWVKLKEFGYIPGNSKVICGYVSKQADKYYVSITLEVKDAKCIKEKSEPIGIDLGLKNFAVCSNGLTKKNINKTCKVKKLEKKQKREQRKLSRKYESLKKNKNKKGEATRQNISKQVVKVQRLHQRLNNIRTDYLNKAISEIIEQNPSSITIEDLNVKGMMKNKHLSKAVAQQKFYEFRVKLENKCKQNNIELRIVDRWYPSSKRCHGCGCIKKDLKLSDREYICECGYHADRDYNASLNLRDALTYETA
ncbi:RNA-guided endonuclease InsQ/TnpB family protein [Clostridium sp. Marseille-P2415]|uniref:RNA-guided endonuclease InsQ/TnpB family protein n=1 Tax=Clostridium sp. Marseille-P2415 TaxID=1805471 RepID=UPI0009887A2A|nr:RNA-guided endonuclease TnpB family protein [Clostridium sp. Marseille-P2415]